MRALILVHRYLGIAIGLVMAMWCLSGFVMMYVPYPTLDETTRVRALAPIDWSACCAVERIAAHLGVDVVDQFSIEMVGGRPILHATLSQGRRHAFDLITGGHLAAFNEAQALSVANEYAALEGQSASPAVKSSLTRDQWTVSGQFDRDRPLMLVELRDERGTELYVSSSTGMIVQHTTFNQRFWNWLGAVPHWLYPTALRQHGALWSQVVIWLSLAGMFLTVIGLYLGISHWRAMKGAKLSPYRGLPLWHHLSGLFFGVLVLTWVGSGWVSMSPWGLFEGTGFRDERDRVRDVWIDGSQIASTVRKLVEARQAATRIESAPLSGTLFLNVYQGAQSRRLDSRTLAPADLSPAAVARIGTQLGGRVQVDIARLDTGDAYYYSGHDARKFPVYRITLDDAERTRYYVDAVTGDVLDKIDPNRRAYRWFFEGLHRIDFVPALRKRPWWDLLVIPLMLGVTAVCVTGVWMGYRRVMSK